MSKAEQLQTFSHLILPGVGHYFMGVSALDLSDLRPAILQFVASGKQLLGVCLGMQLLGTTSDESSGAGLSLIDFTIGRIPPSPDSKVPHIGWNYVDHYEGSKLVSGNTSDQPKYYFNHGFALLDTEQSYVKGISECGTRFAAVVEQDNIFGVQFHPEKSHKFGAELIRKFLSIK